MTNRRFNSAVIAGLLCSISLTGCTAPTDQRPQLSPIRLGQSASPVPTLSPSENPIPDSVSDGFAELELEDQSGGGDSIQVEEVRLSIGRAFLVISDLKGTILGYAIATPDSQPVAVQLQVKITSSQEIIGSLHLDNGDGVFNPEEDLPIRDDEGELVTEDFDYRLTGN